MLGWDGSVSFLFLLGLFVFSFFLGLGGGGVPRYINNYHLK